MTETIARELRIIVSEDDFLFKDFYPGRVVWLELDERMRQVVVLSAHLASFGTPREISLRLGFTVQVQLHVMKPKRPDMTVSGIGAPSWISGSDKQIRITDTYSAVIEDRPEL